MIDTATKVKDISIAPIINVDNDIDKATTYYISLLSSTTSRNQVHTQSLKRTKLDEYDSVVFIL